MVANHAVAISDEDSSDTGELAIPVRRGRKSASLGADLETTSDDVEATNGDVADEDEEGEDEEDLEEDE